MAAVHDICDVEKLRKSNDLAFKWFKRTGLPKNDYLSWVFNCWKKPEDFKKTLTPAYRSAFAKDLKILFYAAKVENDVIKQYEHMISFILKKISHSENQREDLIAIGLIAIRNTCWQFRTVKTKFGGKCGFTTFCHNSIFLRLRSEMSRQRAYKKRCDARIIINLESDMNEFDINNVNIDSRKKIQEADETNELVSRLIASANLDEHEIHLFGCLRGRLEIDQHSENKLWYSSYLQKYKHLFPNGKISREGLRLRVLKLQRKLWFHLHKVQNLPICEMPHFSMHR
jgi:hypothetical protein